MNQKPQTTRGREMANAETRFTPGPWRIARSGAGWTAIYGRRRASPICIFGMGEGCGDDNFPGTEHNARLIVAAPDLYEALQWLLPLAESYLRNAPTHPDNAKLESARAALARAVP